MYFAVIVVPLTTSKVGCTSEIIKKITILFCISLGLHYLCTRKRKYRGMEQLVARQAHNLEVGGSSPPPATKTKTSLRCLFLFSRTEGVIFKTLLQSVLSKL